jgi:hypothetical protein
VVDLLNPYWEVHHLLDVERLGHLGILLEQLELPLVCLRFLNQVGGWLICVMYCRSGSWNSWDDSGTTTTASGGFTYANAGYATCLTYTGEEMV